MQTYKDILTGGGTLDFGDEILVKEAATGNKKTYTWDNINTAMTMIGFGPKVIVRLLSALKKVKKERLTVANEMTTTAQGVGAYSPPLGMTTRTGNLVKQFDRHCKSMARKDMLQQCRKMGLSLGHLKDDDIRKTLLGMSLRNKKKFMGTSMGLGMGHVDNRATDTWKG